MSVAVPRRHRTRARHGGLPAALALASLLTCACAARQLPAVDLGQPGWTVRTGEALWTRTADATPVAGELLIAEHENGDVLVSFSKPPLPLFTARTSGDAWSVSFVQGDTHSGGGEPPSRFVWFHVPDILAGRPGPRRWDVERRPDGEWLLRNYWTGEHVRLHVDP